MNPYFTNLRPEMLPFLPQTISRALDVGCGAGLFGAAIQERFGCEVWGIELNEKAAQEARTRLKQVFAKSIDEALTEIPDHSLDCVIFNDVLEHLPRPETILKALPSKLLPNATVVASVPNIRFFPILRDLLCKRDWKYEDSGVLDQTHLRFFTLKSAKRMFEECGYEILRAQGINPLPAIKSWPLMILSAGWLADTRFLQFGFQLRVKRP